MSTDQMALPVDGAAAAVAARDEAMQRVERNAPRVWMADARACVRALALTVDEFTTDAVWEVLGKPPEPRALGPVMHGFSRSGELVQTGRWEKSSRPECHYRPAPVWTWGPALAEARDRKGEVSDAAAVLEELRVAYEEETAG